MADKNKPELDENGFPIKYDESGYRTTSPEEAEVKKQAIMNLARQNLNDTSGGRNDDTLNQAMLEASRLPAQAPAPSDLSAAVRAQTGAPQPPAPIPPQPQPGMSNGGAIKGVTGGGSVMFGDTVIADHQRPALGYDHAPKFAQGGMVKKYPHYPPRDNPAQVPGLEPAQQEMDMKKNALQKMRKR